LRHFLLRRSGMNLFLRESFMYDIIIIFKKLRQRSSNVRWRKNILFRHLPYILCLIFFYIHILIYFLYIFNPLYCHPFYIFNTWHSPHLIFISQHLFSNCSRFYTYNIILRVIRKNKSRVQVTYLTLQRWSLMISCYRLIHPCRYIKTWQNSLESSLRTIKIAD